MKYLQNIFVSAMAVVALTCTTSCDYLDIEPEDTVAEESVDYANTADMYAPVSGCYAALRNGGCHWVINMLTVIRDGDVWSGRTTDQADLVTIGRNYVYNSSFWGINETWSQYYNMIKICNGALSSLDSYNEYISDEDTRAKYRSYCGEVKILRAYAYYRLCQAFGDVTILDSNEQADLRRSKRDVVYQYVLRDLETAAKDCYQGRPNQNEHIGAVTALTAHALAAKINLIMGNYEEVKRHTEAVIGKCELYPDYYQLFKIPGKLCNESLLEAQATDFGMGSGEYVGVDQFFNSCGPGISNPNTFCKSTGGWNFVGYEESFYNWAIARGETVRAETSFLVGGTTQPSGDAISPASNPDDTNCWNGKWYVPLGQFTDGRTEYGNNNNVRMLRYADVLLMNAEALIRLGQNGDAPFNEVRKRANMPELTGVTIENVLDERRMELCCEWGERYADLLRTGEAAKVLGPNGWTEDKAYYPVPLTQLDLAPALKDEPYTELKF